MPIQRKSADDIFGYSTRAEAERHCDQDLLIRQGMCPNGHGLMQPAGVLVADWPGQQCPT